MTSRGGAPGEAAGSGSAVRGDDMVIGRWIRDRATVTPDRVAIDFCGERTTYAELDDRSERLAAGLVGRGLVHGDRVAVVTTNRPEHVEVLFACAKAGMVLVPLNPRSTPRELAWQLDDAAPALLLVGPGLADLAAAAVHVGTGDIPTQPLTRLEDLHAGGPVRSGPTDGDPLLIVYTSGTTGRPKGAVLTHANCFWTNLSLDRVADVTTTDTVLQVLPQFHVGGWNVQPLLAWWKGATVVLEPDFDPARALARIAEHRVTTMMGVPATYLFMAEEPAFATTDLSSLRQAVVGGGPISEKLLRTYHERGVALAQGYGLTEAAPNVLCLPAEHAASRIGYAGRPYPHVEVALRDRDGATVEGPGRGELCVRGPNTFAGYWRNPEATAAAHDDGWLLTGDVAERDGAGFYRIVDRTKDLYVSGGENVYPAEVESALAEHADVVEVAVVGVPDDRWGESGRAHVVRRGGATVDADGLRMFCRERLAGYKVPREVVFVDELPRSAVGKVLKTALREGQAGGGL